MAYSSLSLTFFLPGSTKDIEKIFIFLAMRNYVRFYNANRRNVEVFTVWPFTLLMKEHTYLLAITIQ